MPLQAASIFRTFISRLPQEGRKKPGEAHTGTPCLSLEVACAIAVAVTTSHRALPKEHKSCEVQPSTGLDYRRTPILVDRLMSTLVCRTSLRELFCAKVSLSLEFLPRRGLGQLCGWKRCQGLILKLHLYSQKQFYGSNIYFGQLWRMLVRAVSEQNPPVPPLSLSCVLALTVPELRQ